MPPLTLSILTTLLQMHGAGTTIASDNKGVDHLLGDVRELLADHADPKAVVHEARVRGHGKEYLKSGYDKITYSRSSFSKATPYDRILPPYGKGT